MKNFKSNHFIAELDEVLDFIAEDSLDKAIVFLNTLEAKLNLLSQMPYKYRKSIYFENTNIRDFIFKGYVIPYLIDQKDKRIVILGIIKYKNKKPQA